MNTPFHNTVIVSNFQPFVQVFLYVFCVFLFVGILDYQQFIIRDTHPTEHRYNGVSHTTSCKYRKGAGALTPTSNLFGDNLPIRYSQFVQFSEDASKVVASYSNATINLQ